METKIEEEIRRKLQEETLEKILFQTSSLNKKQFLNFQEYWKAKNTELVDFEIESNEIYLTFRNKEIPENYMLFQINKDEIYQYFYDSNSNQLYEIIENQCVRDTSQPELSQILSNQIFPLVFDRETIIKFRTIEEKITLAYNSTIAETGNLIRIKNTRNN